GRVRDDEVVREQGPGRVALRLAVQLARGPSGPQRDDGQQGLPLDDVGDERAQGGRDPGGRGPEGGPLLGPGVALAGQLEVPARVGAAGPPPQRDPVSVEVERRGVDVGRHEVVGRAPAGADDLPEVGQVHIEVRVELDLGLVLRPAVHGDHSSCTTVPHPAVPRRPARSGLPYPQGVTDPVQTPPTDGFPFAEARRVVATALTEDLGPDGRDVTSMATIPADRAGVGHVVTREPGVLAGGPVIALVLEGVASRTGGTSPSLDVRVADGATVAAGDVLAVLDGSTQQMLMAERTLL